MIGIGHARRCLTLARALTRHGVTVRFAMRDGGRLLTTLLAEFCDGALVLPTDSDELGLDETAWTEERQAQDFDALRQAAGTFRPDWIIVDHYGLAAPWHEQARACWNCKVLVIDDLGNRPLAAEILVDQNWDRDHQTKYRGQLNRETRLLAGPRYALIDAKFSAEPAEPSGASVGSVGIFLGGTDPTEASGTVLRLLRKAGFAGSAEIVSTSLNPNLTALRSAVEADGASMLALDLPDLFDFFRRHHLYLLAAGSTTWERMASAAPAIAVVTASNQRAIANQLAAEELQWTVPAGDYAALAKQLSIALIDGAARRKMALRGRLLVDGYGAERVVLAMVTHGAAPVTVRRATMADADLILAWRNDPIIRTASRNSEAIDPAAHLAWFAATIASSEKLMLIGEKAGQSIGNVRFDRRDAQTYEVSIFLNPMVHGLGLGGPMLAAAQAALSRQTQRDVDIVAETLPDNDASQRLFLHAGYRQSGLLFHLALHYPPPCSTT